MVEKSDEFDKCMLNRQNFPYQNFALRNFSIAYFTVIICPGSSHYVGTWNPEVPSSNYP